MAKRDNTVKPESYRQYEAARNRVLRPLGRVFSTQKCRECARWFSSERAENSPEPVLCPLHDANAEAARERGKKNAVHLTRGRP